MVCYPELTHSLPQIWNESEHRKYQMESKGRPENVKRLEEVYFHTYYILVFIYSTWTCILACWPFYTKTAQLSNIVKNQPQLQSSRTLGLF